MGWDAHQLESFDQTHCMHLVLYEDALSPSVKFCIHQEKTNRAPGPGFSFPEHYILWCIIYKSGAEYRCLGARAQRRAAGSKGAGNNCLHLKYTSVWAAVNILSTTLFLYIRRRASVICIHTFVFLSPIWAPHAAHKKYGLYRMKILCVRECGRRAERKAEHRFYGVNILGDDQRVRQHQIFPILDHTRTLHAAHAAGKRKVKCSNKIGVNYWFKLFPRYPCVFCKHEGCENTSGEIEIKLCSRI